MKRKYLLVAGMSLFLLAPLLAREDSIITPNRQFFADYEGIRLIIDFNGVNLPVSFATLMTGSRPIVDFCSIDPSGKKSVRSGMDCYRQDCLGDPMGSYSLVIKEIGANQAIVSLRNGYRYSFSPSGDAIAYLNDYPGRWPDGLKPPSDFTDGFYIYYFGAKSNVKIDARHFQNLNWSSHDGNIYLRDTGKLFRYLVKEKRIEETLFNNIYFSPDGKYYSGPEFEGDSHLYRSSDNRIMEEWEKAMIGGIDPERKLYFRFFSAELNAVVFAQSNVRNIVFGLTQEKVLGEFPGWIIGPDPKGKFVVLHPLLPNANNNYDRSRIEIIDLENIGK